MKYWTSTVLALTTGLLVISVHQLFVEGLAASYPFFMLVAISFLSFQWLKRRESEAERRARK